MAVEPVLPVDAATQIAHIEVSGARFVEDPKDRDDTLDSEDHPEKTLASLVRRDCVPRKRILYWYTAIGIQDVGGLPL